MTLVESIVFQNTPTKMNIVFFFLVKLVISELYQNAKHI